MFGRIEAQMALVGINERELARSLGIGYDTLLAKMSGISSFTLDEAVKLRDVLQSGDSIEYLFENANSTVIADSESGLHRGSCLTVSHSEV